MTTDRSSSAASNFLAFTAPRATSRALGALLTASLLSAGCQSDPERKIPTDNTGVTMGQAVVKFCHDIRLDNKPVTLTVEFGQPALAKVSAVSGTCSPPLKMPCTKVPVGLYPGRLLNGTTVLHAVTVGFNDGEEYLLRARISGGRPYLVKDGDFPLGTCPLYDSYVRPDGGADGSATDAGADATLDAAAPDAADAAEPNADAAADAASSD